MPRAPLAPAGPIIALLLSSACATTLPEPIVLPESPQDLQWQRAELIQKQLEYAVGTASENNREMAALLFDMGLDHSGGIYLYRSLRGAEVDWMEGAKAQLVALELELGIDPRPETPFDQALHEGGWPFLPPTAPGEDGSLPPINPALEFWPLLMDGAITDPDNALEAALIEPPSPALQAARTLKNVSEAGCTDQLEPLYDSLQDLQKVMDEGEILSQTARRRHDYLSALRNENAEPVGNTFDYQTGLLLDISPEVPPGLHRLSRWDQATHALPPLPNRWQIPYLLTQIRLAQVRCAAETSSYGATLSYGKLLFENPWVREEARLWVARSAIQNHAIAQAVEILEPLSQGRTLSAYTALNLLRDISPKTLSLHEASKAMVDGLVGRLDAFDARHRAHPQTALYALYQQWMGVGEALPQDLAAAFALDTTLHGLGRRIQSIEAEILLLERLPAPWKNSPLYARLLDNLLRDAHQLRDYAGHLILKRVRHHRREILDMQEAMRGKNNLWNELGSRMGGF